MYLVPELCFLEALEISVVLAIDLAVAVGELVVGALRRLLVTPPVQQRRVQQLSANGIQIDNKQRLLLRLIK